VEPNAKTIVLGISSVVGTMGVTIFTCAGTLRFWQGWLFLAVYAACSTVIVVYARRRDPGLLQRRMRGGPFAEPEPSQRLIMLVVTAGFLGLLVVAGLDRRWGWSHSPPVVALAGDATFVAGISLVALVLLQNSFAAATVAVFPGQRVVTTGAYAIVRHPMYAVSGVMLAGIPLALGSYYALAVLGLLAPALIWRLLDEERYLAARLPGYREYMSKTPWRLVPGIF